MESIKVLPKYQITIPKKIRGKLKIGLGDVLVIEEKEKQLIIKKGKTIFDYIGTLPNLGMSIAEIREKAIERMTKDE